MLDRHGVALTGLHLGIDRLAEFHAHALCFGVGCIIDEAPQIASHALLRGAVDVLTDIGLWDAVT